jgi:hypothetical protein
MKVERGMEFRPIHIILENQEEVRCLYHLANHAETEKLEGYLECYVETVEEVDDFREKLYDKLNDVLGGCPLINKP